MKNITEISSAQMNLPFELRHLHAAAYYRVSTELKEQTSTLNFRNSITQT